MTATRAPDIDTGGDASPPMLRYRLLSTDLEQYLVRRIEGSRRYRRDRLRHGIVWPAIVCVVGVVEWLPLGNPLAGMGLAVLGLGWGIAVPSLLRWHARRAVRRHAASPECEPLLGEHVLVARSQGLEVQRPGGREAVPWPEVTAARRTGPVAVIELADRPQLVVPLRELGTEAVQQFAGHMKAFGAGRDERSA